MRTSRFLVTATLLCAAALPALAATRTVPTSQYPTIQSAVDASRPGDTVNVNPGTYNECVVIAVKGLKLQGIIQNGKAPTLEGIGAPPNSHNGGQNGIEIDSDNVSVSGFIVQDYTDGYTLAGVLISNQLSFPLNPTGCKIQLNTLKNNDIGLNAMSDQTQVTGNFITGNTSAGAEFAGGSGILFQANAVTSNGQIITYYDDNGQPIGTFRNGQGIYTNGLVNFSMQANYFTSNINDAIVIAYDGGGCRAENNYVYGNGGLGFSLYNDPGTMVDNNYVASNAKGIVAIDTTSCILASNQVSQNQGNGIDIESDDAQNYPSTGNQVKSNTVSGNGTAGVAGSAGIYLQSVTGCTIASNQVNSNAANGILFDLLTGYGTAPTTGCSVQSNQMNSNTGDGLKISLGDTGNTIMSCAASGNTPFDAEDDNTVRGANTYKNNNFKKTTPNIPSHR